MSRDLHLVVLDEAGNGIYGPPERGVSYPAESLSGQGRIGGRALRCISAPSLVAFHDTYPGDAQDRADVRALCERFGIEVPQQYR